MIPKSTRGLCLSKELDETIDAAASESPLTTQPAESVRPDAVKMTGRNTKTIC